MLFKSAVLSTACALVAVAHANKPSALAEPEICQYIRKTVQTTVTVTYDPDTKSIYGAAVPEVSKAPVKPVNNEAHPTAVKADWDYHGHGHGYGGDDDDDDTVAAPVNGKGDKDWHGDYDHGYAPAWSAKGNAVPAAPSKNSGKPWGSDPAHGYDHDDEYDPEYDGEDDYDCDDDEDWDWDAGADADHPDHDGHGSHPSGSGSHHSRGPSGRPMPSSAVAHGSRPSGFGSVPASGVPSSGPTAGPVQPSRGPSAGPSASHGPSMPASPQHPSESISFHAGPSASADPSASASHPHSDEAHPHLPSSSASIAGPSSSLIRDPTIPSGSPSSASPSHIAHPSIFSSAPIFSALPSSFISIFSSAAPIHHDSSPSHVSSHPASPSASSGVCKPNAAGCHYDSECCTGNCQTVGTGSAFYDKICQPRISRCNLEGVECVSNDDCCTSLGLECRLDFESSTSMCGFPPLKF